MISLSDGPAPSAISHQWMVRSPVRPVIIPIIVYDDDFKTDADIHVGVKIDGSGPVAVIAHISGVPDSLFYIEVSTVGDVSVLPVPRLKNQIVQMKHTLVRISCDMIDKVMRRFIAGIVIPSPSRHMNGIYAGHGDDMFDPRRTADQQVVMVPGVRNPAGSPTVDERIIIISVGIQNPQISFSIDAVDNEKTIM